MLKHLIERLIGRHRPPAPRFDVLVEDKVTLHGCDLLGPISVGYRSYANDSLLRNVTIGRFTSIGRRCSIGGALHDLAAFTTHPIAAGRDFVRDPETVVGNDVWIGDNVVIVAGVTIGDGAVIGAGAIVTRDVPPYTIVTGVPARSLRARFPEREAAALLASQWWRFGDAAVKAAGAGASPDALVAALEQSRPAPMPPHFSAWVPA
jgi:acetyltransferase-like isoleucine patch superfamily enzyme